MTPADANPATTFTSDLTVDELILLADAGWEPVAFVSGDYTSDPGDGLWSHVSSQGDALTRGQSGAMERMRQQAADVGATGVVGVRLRTTRVELVEDTPALFHFSALGTAVRPVGASHGKKVRPFTSHLSGQDTWALLAAGCKPLGLVVGIGLYRPRGRYQRQTGLYEMPDLTEAVYGAREHAMHHMQGQAAGLHASGVVGVSVDMEVTRSHRVMFTAIGTAITVPAHRVDAAAPRLAVELTDRAELALAKHRVPLHGQAGRPSV